MPKNFVTQWFNALLYANNWLRKLHVITCINQALFLGKLITMAENWFLQFRLPL